MYLRISYELRLQIAQSMCASPSLYALNSLRVDDNIFMIFNACEYI
jgi:hypothetical protein